MEPMMNAQDLYKVTEVELVYRSRVKNSERPTLKDSKSTYELLLRIWDKDKIDLQEEFKVLMLNCACRVLGIYNASEGGITGTVADLRLIYATALKGTAVSIIIAHNHPSGNLQPSRGDEALTQKVKEGGDILDIKLLDHLIITSEGYYSFADQGRL